MQVNKIGFHFGSQATAKGWGDYVRRLDAAGIPAVLMSVAGEGFGDIAACWDAGSTVPHVVCIRYGGVQGNHDVPPYGADPKQAAVDWWAWYKPRIGPDALKYKDRIVLKMGNELDKNQSEWLADFYMDLYTILQSDQDGPFRMAAFAFASGEPEPEHWRGPKMLAYLRICAADPIGAAVCLHEYSYADTLDNQAPYLIGRFQDLFAACDEHGIKRPLVYIHEFGWRQDTLPGVSTAMAQLPWAAELYAAHPEIKGAGIWTLQGSGSYGNINVLAQQLIAPMTEYSLTAVFPDPEPPTPPNGGDMDCNPRVSYTREYYVLPQDATMARYLEVAQQAFAGRKTLAFSYDDAGHAPGVSSNTAVLYDIPADKQQEFVDWYAEHYPATQVIFAGGDQKPPDPDPEPGNPLDGLKLGHLFTVPYALTSGFNAPRDYGPHEGADYDVIGTNPNSKELVLCTYDGTVERSLDSTGGYGKYVRVVHERNGRQFYTRYCHLDTRMVQVGQAIKAGQPVGEIGTTGNVSGEHVHFNLEVPGFGLSGYVVADVVDPVPYLPKPITRRRHWPPARPALACIPAPIPVIYLAVKRSLRSLPPCFPASSRC
jgi:murein DD-endopeptidase MepM/ murein hydrolase activator NlpD